VCVVLAQEQDRQSGTPSTKKMTFLNGMLMVNSVLRKLRGPRVDFDEAASLLEKHIGDGANEQHCIDAIETIWRMRNKRIQGLARTVDLLQPRSATHCDRVRALISQLRGSQS
jgi:hypothetical protein